MNNKLLSRLAGNLRRFWLKYMERESIAVVIPAYNEAKTIAAIVKKVRASGITDEIIVVDDGSADRTAEIAAEAGADVVRHSKNKGKGAAIASGVRRARSKIVCFVDADLLGFKPDAVEKLVMPIIVGQADFVKGLSKKKLGRVTGLVARPLMKYLFKKDIRQPLTGEFAARKALIQKMKLEKRWGIDSGMLVEAIRKGVRVQEVEIGSFEHKHKNWTELMPMADDVVKTMLERAGVLSKTRGLVAFDLDRTLIRQSSIEALAAKLGFREELEALRRKLRSGKLRDYQVSTRLAARLKGVPVSVVGEVAKRLELAPHAERVVEKLRTRGYKVAIVSSAYRPVAEAIGEKLGVDEVVCAELPVKDGVITGRTSMQATPGSRCRVHGNRGCKAHILAGLAKKHGVSLSDCIAVGDSFGDACMLRKAGVGLAFNADDAAIKSADNRIRDLAEILLYA